MPATDDESEELAIPVEDRLELMKRIEAGERAATIAAEYGVTRQYVSLLWKKYREEGPDAISSAKRGRRRTRRLSSAERKQLDALVDKEPPSKYGLPGEFLDEDLELWTVESLRALVERKFGFVPNKGDVKTILLGRGMPVSMGETLVGKRTPGDPLEPGQVVPSLAEFKASKGWRDRVAKAEEEARAKRAAEAEAAAKLVKAGAGEVAESLPAKRKRGRPRKDAVDDLDLDLAELERIRKRIEAGLPVMPERPVRGGPGVRVGKNRGSKAAPTKKKRKKGKK